MAYSAVLAGGVEVEACDRGVFDAADAFVEQSLGFRQEPCARGDLVVVAMLHAPLLAVAA
ncbi:hypothetical protein [Streptomyces iranensis]|uniref:Uncharacterized protein n=1 Tax=Streptomyces iranensis TaxID=576784 RepID=A0A060ZBG8_9ACTN|nr:hypothetical protein [Streptomyces iranensis]MBP2063424.1 hypothetical protein [Streptomyces iranensis]CDR01506.1 predicted protein [Streptomyces iranensis]